MRLSPSEVNDVSGIEWGAVSTAVEGECQQGVLSMAATEGRESCVPASAPASSLWPGSPLGRGVRMQRYLGPALLVFLQFGCATAGRPAEDPSGTYFFEAWSGERVFRGELTVRASRGAWVGSIQFEGGQRLEAVRMSYEEGELVLVAEGPARMVRVIATITGSRMRGTWSGGDASGSFRAKRAIYGGLRWTPLGGGQTVRAGGSLPWVRGRTPD
jgi:hypothetical protein